MTDHKNEAERLLTDASNTSVNSDIARWYLARAEVHATLYLAEQQRIDNLMKFATFRWEDGGEALFTSLEMADTLRTAAGTALGLK